ncbi:hypothetical protein HK099_005189 [Clydaea vesicula]|uniref:Uncharacterized protein n=1 Tax=Clydaea vesicula TaxID=447962 RepID=A0AAD5XV47_9FUNG|nr:hypothetical protein HK099_005189 [Clydaea vesicula]KAJ3379356.1 hypothetical protein HDU92_006752 [Lobulomyces angularis]
MIAIHHPNLITHHSGSHLNQHMSSIKKSNSSNKNLEFNQNFDWWKAVYPFHQILERYEKKNVQKNFNINQKSSFLQNIDNSKKKCKHDKIRCRECHGFGCPHGRQRSRCKDCGGSEICIHSKVKYHCKECKGSGICEHGKQKLHCRPCILNSTCKHLIKKRDCNECNHKTSVSSMSSQEGGGCIRSGKQHFSNTSRYYSDSSSDS